LRDRNDLSTYDRRREVVLAWQWPLHPLRSLVISASSEAQLEENLQALGVELSAEQLATLDDAAAYSLTPGPW